MPTKRYLPKGAEIHPIFRASGPRPFDPTALAARFGLTAVGSWRHGEVEPHGRVCAESGFTIPFGKARSADTAFKRCERFLSSQRELITALHGLGAVTTIHLALFVSHTVSSPAAVTVPAELMALLLETGTGLTFSCDLTTRPSRSAA